MFRLLTYNLQSVEHKLACQVDTVANPLDMPMLKKFWNNNKKENLHSLNNALKENLFEYVNSIHQCLFPEQITTAV